MTIVLIILGYLICSVLSAGMLVAHSQSGYSESRRIETGQAYLVGLFAGLLGPAGVLFVFLLTGFAERGWRLW